MWGWWLEPALEPAPQVMLESQGSGTKSAASCCSLVGAGLTPLHTKILWSQRCIWAQEVMVEETGGPPAGTES